MAEIIFLFFYFTVVVYRKASHDPYIKKRKRGEKVKMMQGSNKEPYRRYVVRSKHSGRSTTQECKCLLATTKEQKSPQKRVGPKLLL